MGFSEDNAELHNEIVQTFIKGYNRTAPFKVEYNKELIFGHAIQLFQMHVLFYWNN